MKSSFWQATLIAGLLFIFASAVSHFRNAIYKIDLTKDVETINVTPQTNINSRPDFKVPETQVGADYDPLSDVYKTVDGFLNK